MRGKRHRPSLAGPAPPQTTPGLAELLWRRVDVDLDIGVRVAVAPLPSNFDIADSCVSNSATLFMGQLARSIVATTFSRRTHGCLRDHSRVNHRSASLATLDQSSLASFLRFTETL